jgi:hypothetical protein
MTLGEASSKPLWRDRQQNGTYLSQESGNINAFIHWTQRITSTGDASITGENQPPAAYSVEASLESGGRNVDQ